MDYDFSNFVLPESLSNSDIAVLLTNISQMSTQTSTQASTQASETIQSACQAIQELALDALSSSNKAITDSLSTICNFANTFSNLEEHNFSEDNYLILDGSFKKIIDFPDVIHLKTGKTIIRINMNYVLQMIGILITLLSLFISICQKLPQQNSYQPRPCLQEHFEEERSQSSDSDNPPHAVQSPSDNTLTDD